jgi:hypothetical protein
MKQLREHIKKQISRLMEEKYPLPQELVDALKHDLKLNPLVRYVNFAKAAATVPPSYEITLTNGASFFLIYESFSLAVEIEGKKYYLGELEELSLAKQHLNKILKEPQINPNKGGEGEEGEEETPPEGALPTEEEPAEEEPEA